MSTHLLRVVWPILDDALYDSEAMRLAEPLWRIEVEQRRVKLTGPPHMRVIDLDGWQRSALEAHRVVVCEAPAEPRTDIDFFQEEAA